MSSVARIKAYIDFKGIKKTDFYKKTGLSNGYLDKVKDLGSEKIESIIYVYKDLNLEWLITGNGQMLKEATPTSGPTPEHMKLKDELIDLQREIIRLQKENAELIQKDKRDKHTAIRPVAVKLK